MNQLILFGNGIVDGKHTMLCYTKEKNMSFNLNQLDGIREDKRKALTRFYNVDDVNLSTTEVICDISKKNLQDVVHRNIKSFIYVLQAVHLYGREYRYKIVSAEYNQHLNDYQYQTGIVSVHQLIESTEKGTTLLNAKIIATKKGYTVGGAKGALKKYTIDPYIKSTDNLLNKDSKEYKHEMNNLHTYFTRYNGQTDRVVSELERMAYFKDNILSQYLNFIFQDEPRTKDAYKKDDTILNVKEIIDYYFLLKKNQSTVTK